MIKRGILLVMVVLLVSCCTTKSSQVNWEPKRSGRPNPFHYRDVALRWHEMTIDPAVKKNKYDKDAFKIKQNKVYYIGDKRYSSRLGLDISKHNGSPNWWKLRGWGLDFVILRIGYMGYESGAIMLDERFRKNYKGAKDAGFDIGVYFFSQAINEKEANDEADFVLGELGGRELALPVVYDPESIAWNKKARTKGLGRDVFTRTTKVFCERIKEAGYEPMVYCNMIWQDEMLDMAQLNDYKIWYSDYEPKPQSPYHWDFWQYTDEANIPGAATRKTDLNIWLIPEKKKKSPTPPRVKE